MNCYCAHEPLPEFYFATRPHARKPHRCTECGEEIATGEIYERVRAKWEGQLYVLLTCVDCLALRDAFEEMDCFCWFHHSLMDDIQMQLQEADFRPGEHFGYLRLAAQHQARRAFKERQAKAKAKNLWLAQHGVGQ